MTSFAIYRSRSEGLSFHQGGKFVGMILAPRGSSLEECHGIEDTFGDVSSVLMVPAINDPSVRYAWTATDLVVESQWAHSRFQLIDFVGVRSDEILRDSN